ncbi:MAG: flagellar biosynthesis anti-sigma factor FlgM [Bdellovibrionaceae bacterium]|nr:flagellar biosynthesis anti-sigma factor FlgM [Pseudobdellovibrionaceae bacterium]
MKITHNKVGQNLNTADSAKSSKAEKAGDASSAKKSSTASSSDAAASSQATKVELSPKAQDIKKIKELAMNAPDVDSNKVEKFKRMIADGTYKVDAKAVADRMVDEHMMSAGKTSE